MERTACPHCGQSVVIDGSVTGRLRSCPACSERFRMPHSSPVSPATAQPTIARSSTVAESSASRWRQTPPNTPNSLKVPAIIFGVALVAVSPLALLVAVKSNSSNTSPTASERRSTRQRESSLAKREADIVRRERELERREAELARKERELLNGQSWKPTTHTDAIRSVAPADVATLGPKPRAGLEGSLQCVKDYLNRNLDDPTGLQFVSWSGVAPVRYSRDVNIPTREYWGVRVSFRAKNALGALRLKTYVFFIRHGQVEWCADMEPADQFDRYVIQRDFPPGTFPGEGALRKSQYVEDTEAVQSAVDRFLDPANFPFPKGGPGAGTSPVTRGGQSNVP